jgi:alkylation response protein AidB-like acyl-CoA dehydrogenase
LTACTDLTQICGSAANWRSRVPVNAAAKRALEACASPGLFATGFPQEWGGLQLPATVTLLVNRMLACANLPLVNYQLACRYFFRYELPRALPGFGLVAALDDTCLRMRQTDFLGV